jgi:hypothetical protein
MKSAGSPKTLIAELLHHSKDLPHGAAEQLQEADNEVKNELIKILKEYKDVFPADLPKELPPNRGLNDVHHIPLEPGAVPPSKRMYRNSPAEQLLIKE